MRSGADSGSGDLRRARGLRRIGLDADDRPASDQRPIGRRPDAADLRRRPRRHRRPARRTNRLRLRQPVPSRPDVRPRGDGCRRARQPPDGRHRRSSDPPAAVPERRDRRGRAPLRRTARRRPGGEDRPGVRPRGRRCAVPRGRGRPAAPDRRRRSGRPCRRARSPRVLLQRRHVRDGARLRQVRDRPSPRRRRRARQHPRRCELDGDGTAAEADVRERRAHRRAVVVLRRPVRDRRPVGDVRRAAARRNRRGRPDRAPMRRTGPRAEGARHRRYAGHRPVRVRRCGAEDGALATTRSGRTHRRSPVPWPRRATRRPRPPSPPRTRFASCCPRPPPTTPTPSWASRPCSPARGWSTTAAARRQRARRSPLRDAGSPVRSCSAHRA